MRVFGPASVGTVLVLAACNSNGAADLQTDTPLADAGVDSGGSGADGAAPDGGGIVFEAERGERIFEFRQDVEGEGAPIASNNYFCVACASDDTAAAAYDSVSLPEGFQRSPSRTLEAARTTLFFPVNSRGAPEAVDLLDGVTGDESLLGAQPLRGEFIEGGGVLVTMESTRRLEWAASDTVEELSDGDQTLRALRAGPRRGGRPAVGGDAAEWLVLRI